MFILVEIKLNIIIFYIYVDWISVGSRNFNIFWYLLLLCSYRGALGSEVHAVWRFFTNFWMAFNGFVIYL